MMLSGSLNLDYSIGPPTTSNYTLFSIYGTLLTRRGTKNTHTHKQKEGSEKKVDYVKKLFELLFFFHIIRIKCHKVLIE